MWWGCLTISSSVIIGGNWSPYYESSWLWIRMFLGFFFVPQARLWSRDPDLVKLHGDREFKLFKMNLCTCFKPLTLWEENMRNLWTWGWRWVDRNGLQRSGGLFIKLCVGSLLKVHLHTKSKKYCAQRKENPDLENCVYAHVQGVSFSKSQTTWKFV